MPAMRVVETVCVLGDESCNMRSVEAGGVMRMEGTPGIRAHGEADGLGLFMVRASNNYLPDW
eukprot:scaffold241397_cov31-Tisochrysis_lutea.AAC.5